MIFMMDLVTIWHKYYIYSCNLSLYIPDINQNCFKGVTGTKKANIISGGTFSFG